MTKYKAKTTLIDGIKFDSKQEGEYYLYLKEQQEKGIIERFELQPKFILQEGFRKEGKWIRPIVYIADFDIWYKDGTRRIVDVKGVITPEFRIKKKLFEMKYPFVELSLMKYVKKFGGWLEYEDWKKKKRKQSKTKMSPM